MKIENKGVINTYREAERPVSENAVKYIDPEAMEHEGKGTAFYCIMAMIFPIIIFSVKYAMIGEIPLMFSIAGIAIGCVLSLPREILRGLCFPKGSTTELYQMIKPPRMFVTCNIPMSKGRFVFVNMVPGIMLGIVPLMVWLFISPYTYLARTLFSIGFISIIAGGRDYMNILKTIVRVPPFSGILMSGAKIYYFYDCKR